MTAKSHTRQIERHLMDLDLPRIPARIHLTGEALEQFEAKVCAAYQQNPKISIRKIADATDRSYGAIHRLLKRCGIPMRARVGPTAVDRARVVSRPLRITATPTRTTLCSGARNSAPQAVAAEAAARCIAASPTL